MIMMWWGVIRRGVGGGSVVMWGEGCERSLARESTGEDNKKNVLACSESTCKLSHSKFQMCASHIVIVRDRGTRESRSWWLATVWVLVLYV